MSNAQDCCAEEGGKLENKQKWQFWKMCPINYADKERKCSSLSQSFQKHSQCPNIKWDGYKYRHLACRECGWIPFRWLLPCFHDSVSANEMGGSTSHLSDTFYAGNLALGKEIGK